MPDFSRRSFVGGLVDAPSATAVANPTAAGPAVREAEGALTYAAIELPDGQNSDRTTWPCVGGIAVTCSYGPCTYTILASEASSLCSAPLIDD
jgi:hypothetical protein